jgi:hypothetical protein
MWLAFRWYRVDILAGTELKDRFLAKLLSLCIRMLKRKEIKNKQMDPLCRQRCSLWHELLYKYLWRDKLDTTVFGEPIPDYWHYICISWRLRDGEEWEGLKAEWMRHVHIVVRLFLSLHKNLVVSLCMIWRKALYFADNSMALLQWNNALWRLGVFKHWRTVGYWVASNSGGL